MGVGYTAAAGHGAACECNGAGVPIATRARIALGTPAACAGFTSAVKSIVLMESVAGPGRFPPYQARRGRRCWRWPVLRPRIPVTPASCNAGADPGLNDKPADPAAAVADAAAVCASCLLFVAGMARKISIKINRMWSCMGTQQSWASALSLFGLLAADL